MTDYETHHFFVAPFVATPVPLAYLTQNGVPITASECGDCHDDYSASDAFIKMTCVRNSTPWPSVAKAVMCMKCGRERRGARYEVTPRTLLMMVEALSADPQLAQRVKNFRRDIAAENIYLRIVCAKCIERGDPHTRISQRLREWTSTRTTSTYFACQTCLTVAPVYDEAHLTVSTFEVTLVREEMFVRIHDVARRLNNIPPLQVSQLVCRWCLPKIVRRVIVAPKTEKPVDPWECGMCRLIQPPTPSADVRSVATLILPTSATCYVAP